MLYIGTYAYVLHDFQNFDLRRDVRAGLSD